MRLPGRGRPPRYCSPACKRAAEAKRRRLEAHVGFVAKRLVLRIEDAALNPMNDRKQAVVDALQDELDAAEAALLALYRAESADTVERTSDEA